VIWLSNFLRPDGTVATPAREAAPPEEVGSGSQAAVTTTLI
jgi:hypothetical protein